MNGLKVYKNDITEWVIAWSPADATAVLKEQAGWDDDTLAEYFPDGVEWQECPRAQDFTYHDPDNGPITKKFGEWIDERGRCYLATTEY